MVELLATTLYQAHALFYTLPEGMPSDPSLPSGLLFSALETITSQHPAGEQQGRPKQRHSKGVSPCLVRTQYSPQWTSLFSHCTIFLGKGITVLKEETKLSTWFKYLPPSVTEFQLTLRTLAHPISQDYLRDTLQKWINMWVCEECLLLEAFVIVSQWERMLCVILWAYGRGRNVVVEYCAADTIPLLPVVWIIRDLWTAQVYIQNF